MAPPLKDVPLGIRTLQKCCNIFCPGKSFNRNAWYRSSVVVLTFLTYMCYHMNRKPISVVKNVLHRNCSEVNPKPINTTNPDWCDWAPFDGENAASLLGFFDSSFLFAYAGAMFISGLVAERVSLRYFLSLGMLLSGLAGYLLGIAKYYNIHSISYFMLVQVFGGVAQTTGWPGVVAVMGNWFGKGKRGFIFGVWNSHTSIGNILGTVIAGYYVEDNWALSFIVPGVIMSVLGFVNFLFLVPNPTDVGCVSPDQNRPKDKSNLIQLDRMDETTSKVRGAKHVRKRSSIKFKTKQKSGRSQIRQILKSVKNVVEVHKNGDISKINSEGRPILYPDHEAKPVGFFGALRIPGVVEFSLCLFFAKLVSYTFLYWLPGYIKTSTTLNPTESADLSVVFDIGGIVGGIAAGIISDYSGKSASTCAVMLVIAVPILQVYNLYGADSVVMNVFLLLVAGLLVNGPYALITTAVSAELGTHHSLQGNSKALATVTAIIDGTGSIGAAVGPLLAGVVSQYGWGKVFYMLMASDVIALLLLTRLVKREIMPMVQSSHTNTWQA
ncbi:glucose-6-phosphate exchanger SLC37A2-like isoform X1 [Macrosteles quadrilineatus]|uniref:glucose-6-phosphate exchanger SLC37A2-like isoform X1 n=1 Tax=Macrosteles quadrilineatus TaxID=74068 RepID=UPI0023E0E457|nr:glucose-6-phosphate exchanger SLC37A2-like isoform X1 [Macrosteles quadrilineatus]